MGGNRRGRGGVCGCVGEEIDVTEGGVKGRGRGGCMGQRGRCGWEAGMMQKRVGEREREREGK